MMASHRLVALIAAAVLSVGTIQSASARLLTYTVTFKASGSAAGKAFANRQVKLAYTSDTNLVASSPEAALDKIATIIAAGAYIPGMGFGAAAIAKFKAHKENPVQNGALVIESSSEQASPIRLSGSAVSSYRLGRERKRSGVKVSAALPLSLPVLTDAGQSTLVITSIASGGATFSAHFSE